MGSNGSEITVGYWYRVGMHMLLAHTVHAFLRIKAGDKNAWAAPSGGITESQQIYINKPNLFGGEQREGGIDGNVDLVMGTGSEPVNAYLQRHLPTVNPDAVGTLASRFTDNEGWVPAFRGVSGLVLKSPRVMANNPNIRPWNVEVFYQPAKDWYAETEIILDSENPDINHCIGVNPAHALRECLTNIDWGLGYSPLELDDASFRAAALTLFDEKFGINLVWDTEAPLEDFIGVIIQHASGILYVDPATGLFVFKLLRDDYDRNTLPVLDESTIIDLVSYERLSTAELVNQVVILWYDNTTDKQRSATEHNTAVRELQGGVVSATLQFPGLGTPDLASKVANRELRRLSSAFARISLITGRTGASFKVGDVFKLSWDDYGISGAIYRVARIGYPAADATQIMIDAVEDVFSAGLGVYAPPRDTYWEDPISEPAPTPLHQATEAPYILVERALNESATLIGEIDPMAGFLTYQATSPSSDAFNYTLYTRLPGSEFAPRSVSQFTPTAITLAALTPAVTSVVGINLEGDQDISTVKLNSYAILGEELVAVTALTTSSVTLTRGVLDTVPVAHPIGQRLWFVDGGKQGYDTTQWLDGVTVQAKASPLTGKGSLDLALAPTDFLLIQRRWYRPYPPGNVKVNGERWPTDSLVGEPVFTWSHRDRTTQLSYYVAQDEGDFGPEVGTTYTVRVYDRDLVLKREVTGITTTTWTYATADESTDNPGPVFTVTISSVRDGIESWQAQQVIIFREGIGWSYNWGNFWSGYAGAIGYGQQYGDNWDRYG